MGAGLPGRNARWPRLAVWGLLASVATVCGFTWWTVAATSRATATASAAATLSGHYQNAARAVAAEEALERKYRLDPGPAVRLAFDRAARELVAALDGIDVVGDAADRATVDQVRTVHARYRVEVGRVFAAVDTGALDRAGRIDEQQADPLFTVMEPTVVNGAAEHRRTAEEAMQRMIVLQRRAAQQIPVVFLIGLVSAGTSGHVLRRYRRQLDAQRRRAVSDAEHDPLTGLPNRVLLARRLEAAVRKDTTTRRGVVLLDLDRFQDINDALGHGFGDRLLAQVAARLTETLRDGDTVARLGGDEFAVLLPEVADIPAAVQIAERLRDAAELPVQLDGITVDVEASIGVVVAEPGCRDASTLLRQAEVAMYVAKRHKRGINVYSPAEDRHDPDRLALLGDLRAGMDRRELVLHYQPKVDLATGLVCGVEALVRWNHPARGLVMPAAFIPLAEQTGLIGPLTRYVLHEALTDARRWADRDRPLTVSVNLAARNLTDENLYDDITRALADHGLPAAALRLELTESAVITEPELARRLLGRLHAAGIAIALDDFGAGYTSLRQLTDLPISELKIDRGYVGAMATDPRSATIVENVVRLAHDLGMTTVAEGIQDAATLAALRRVGCQIGQGFHFSRAVPATALDDRHPATSLAAFSRGDALLP